MPIYAQEFYTELFSWRMIGESSWQDSPLQDLFNLGARELLKRSDGLTFHEAADILLILAACDIPDLSCWQELQRAVSQMTTQFQMAPHVYLCRMFYAITAIDLHKSGLDIVTVPLCEPVAGRFFSYCPFRQAFFNHVHLHSGRKYIESCKLINLVKSPMRTFEHAFPRYGLRSVQDYHVTSLPCKHWNGQEPVNFVKCNRLLPRTGVGKCPLLWI